MRSMIAIAILAFLSVTAECGKEREASHRTIFIVGALSAVWYHAVKWWSAGRTSRARTVRSIAPYESSTWMADGGIQSRKVSGARVDFGFNAVEDRYHVNGLHTTMLWLLRLAHEKLAYFFEGRERRLTTVVGSNDWCARLVRD